MWYKCLNPNCGFIFPAIEECDKCPDCGKQDLREATDEERKPSLDDVIKKADKIRDAQDIPPKSSKKDGGKQRGKDFPEHIPIPREPEL